MSREGYVLENDYLSDDNLENFTINRILLFSLNLLTLVGLSYFGLILQLNASTLYLLYDIFSMEVFQVLLTILLIVTVYINTKLIIDLSENWKALSVALAVYFVLSLAHGIVLYQNPTTIDLISEPIGSVLIQPEFWMIFFYPLVVIFYIVPIMALIQINQSMGENIKFSLILFLSSFGLMFFTQASKIWNTTGWSIPMLSYDLRSVVIPQSGSIIEIANINISIIGYLMVILSILLFIAGIVILLRDIAIEPNSIFTLIPYIFLILIIGSDYAFSKIPVDIKFFNIGFIIIWFIIGVLYTIAYTLIPNSVLNSQISDKGKFTPNIKSRFHDKKIETQILDAIEENKITKLIEISSFLGLPYHKILKSLKNSILQGYISGRILNQQFIFVDELHSFEQLQHSPDFPSPFEIWKITMINEGVISIDDLSAIMSMDVKDLELALTTIDNFQPEKNNLVEGYIYIKTISELDSLYSNILSNLTKPVNSQSLN